MKLNDEDRKIVENDVQHINNLKINTARRNRNIYGATAAFWLALCGIALMLDLRLIAFAVGTIGVINAFRMNSEWKKLIELYEVEDER